jgi:hypothetical protein
MTPVGHNVRGGVSAYRDPLLVHYLDSVLYPKIPSNLLIAGAVYLLNLWIYARRLRVQHSLR